MDVINFKIFKSNKVDDKLLEMIDNFKEKKTPILPIKANILMEKYNILQGKDLGNKLKEIEELWVNNNFQISDKEVEKIVNN